MNILNKDDSLLLIVDIQEKLVKALDKDVIVKNSEKLVKAANLLEIPVVLTQQYPKGLGETIPEIKNNLGISSFMDKTSFNACLEDDFLDLIRSYNKKQIVICGIETHICVHQTTAALIEEGFEVFVAKDVCASRRKYEFKQGIDIMQQNGAKISCLEIILFEWLKNAKNPVFKDVQALIK